MPSSVKTTFKTGANSPFDFGKPVSNDGTAVWKFDPSEAKFLLGGLDIQVDAPDSSKNIDVGLIVAVGTGTSPSDVSINTSGLKTHFKDVIRGLKQAFVPGFDGQPGQAGIDDDGNGTIDDLTEYGAAGSDDSEQIVYDIFNSPSAPAAVKGSSITTATLAGVMKNVVIPTATNFVNLINRGLFLASNRFTTEFANFLPGQTYTDGQLEAKATELANDLLMEVKKDFQAVSSGIKIVESNDEADVTVTWEDTFSSSSNLPIYGGADRYDFDTDAMRAVIGTPGRTDPVTGNTFNLEISDAAQQWALADLINDRVNNSARFGLGINISWTNPNTSWAQFIANTVSHELGHNFGLNEAYISPIPTNIPGTAGCNAEGNCFPNDIMRLGHNNDPDLSFDPITLELLKASVGIHPNGDKPISSGLTLWRDNFNLRNGLDNVNGFRPFINPPPHSSIKLSHDSASFFGLGRRIDTYGLVAADGVGNQSRTVTYEVTNDGNAPLIIYSISLEHGNKGFSVIDGDSLIGVTIAPNESKTLSIRFDPTVIGNLEDTLRIESNSSDWKSTWEMKLNGQGISPTPSPEVSLAENNNFGGVPVEGETANIKEVVTITNHGAQPLTISGLRIIEGEDAFTMTSSLENPVSLNFSESFTFGDFKFDPNIVGLDRAIVEILTNAPQNPRFSLVGTGLDKVVYPEWRNDFIAVEFPELPNPFELRTVSDNAGNFHFFLPVETRYGITIFDPVTGLVGDRGGATPPTGGYINFTSTMVFRGSYEQDSDGDGLPDDVEFAIGSSPNSLDTDKDGIDDFQEIQQGLDPLTDVGFPTGIIASLPLSGEAKAVVVEGDPQAPQNQTAYVATGSHGLAIIDATKFSNPIIQGQLSLPGDATDIAVDPKLKIAAVATNSGGLQIVDISDPMVPTLRRTINITANQVEIFDGIVYATAGTSLRAYDLLTGAELDNATLPGSGTVTGLAREGTNLYAYISGSDTFSIIDITNPTESTILGQLNVRIASSEVGVFAANGVAYLAGSGMHTIDISDPNNITLISDANSFFPARNIAGNGSGLAAIAVEDRGLSVYDITNPENTDTFLTRFDTPGFARDIAIASGIAYVADDTGGLQVINYLPFDNKGVAPTITITSGVTDVDPDTEGVQVTEGGDIPIIAAVTDDVQVRNVELLVNGEVVSNDVSFPFDLAAKALSNDPDATIVEVQARATDTGGNTALSNVLTFDLVPDTFGPVIESITPADGGNAPFNSRRVTVRFNEALRDATVTAENFQLLNAKGEVITPENIQLRSGDRIVQLTYSALEVGEYSILIKSAQVSDRAGNTLGSENVVTSFTVNPQVEFNLSDLDGSNGFVLNGIDSGDRSGESVSGAGDINGDGIDDLIIGAPNANPNDYYGCSTGQTYVVFGSDEGFDASLNLSTLNGSNGFVINGIDRDDRSGHSVSGAGDINGDGFDDLIIGAFLADPNGNRDAGETYVVFGSNQGFAPSLDLSDLNGSNGFVLNGIDRDDESGFSVSGAGDINGDGFHDLIIGAHDAYPNGRIVAGETYVVFGSDEGFDPSLDLSNLNGSNGFILNGIDSFDRLGWSVSGAGDINGDGFDDLIIGAFLADLNGNRGAGETYVVFGSDEGFDSSFDLSNLNGSNGFILNGIDSFDRSGESVSGAGDINGDGFDDLIIGAPFADPNGNRNAGETYVVFGNNEGFAASLDLSTLNGSNGFVLNGIDRDDESGRSVSGAGDINGDGFDDLIIGANRAESNGNLRTGETYVIFGSNQGFAASLDLSNLNGSNGFILNGIDSFDRSGNSVSGAGDINGDGIDDIIIGAPDAYPNRNSVAGETYVVFGSRAFG